jgi:D-glycero-D-manno-heptose 1,7-bisphosphate phosphatase
LKNRAVILDRDGVLNVDKGYVHRMEDFELLPRVIDALQLLPEDFRLIIITNQSGIGRGFYTEEQFLELMRNVKRLFAQDGIHVDEVYYCPHLPSDNCSCRKPATELLERAVAQFGLDRKRCFVIGDHTSDIKMGEDGGCRTILVKTGFGGTDGKYRIDPEYVAQDLYDAIRYVASASAGAKDRSSFKQ